MYIIKKIFMKTVLITGATEGIGYEFAKLFAQNKFNIVLVARNENKLKSIVGELTSPDVNVKYYAKDLSILDNAKYIYNDLKDQGININYLINNAGFGTNGLYTDIDWQKEYEMFNLNMLTVAYFTKNFAADMKENKFGRILNIGSTGSFQPGPYMAGYCASKAFVLSLSEAVNYELKGTGVTVSTLCPGVTDTMFHTVALTTSTLMSKMLTHASAHDVAKYGYKIMMRGKSLGIHGYANKIMILFNRLTCRKVIISAAAKLLKNKTILY
jgi:short-subunit dehydrogenase